MRRRRLAWRSCACGSRRRSRGWARTDRARPGSAGRRGRRRARRRAGEGRRRRRRAGGRGPRAPACGGLGAHVVREAETGRATGCSCALRSTARAARRRPGLRGVLRRARRGPRLRARGDAATRRSRAGPRPDGPRPNVGAGVVNRAHTRPGLRGRHTPARARGGCSFAGGARRRARPARRASRDRR